ncbi:MAG: PilZ domain-containing protein, partial [candidate division NC10 bacterium]
SARGETVDLSAFAAKVATELELQPGDLVTLSLSPAAPGTTLTLPAVVWDVGSTGSVLVFVNLPRSDFGRLGAYVSSLLQRES